MARGDGFLVWQGAKLRWRLVSVFGHLAVQRKRTRSADNPLPSLVEQWRHCVQERDRHSLKIGTGQVFESLALN